MTPALVPADLVSSIATDASGAVLQASGGVTFNEPMRAAATLVTFAVVAAVAAGSAAVAYRWYFRERVGEGIAALVGVAVVALYLNTASLGAVIGGTEYELLRLDAVFFNVVAIGVAAAAAPVGLHLGDGLATNFFAVTGGKRLEGEVSDVVRTIGRVTPVTLPAVDDIGDMDAYEPVDPETKTEMADKTLLFPRRLTVEELRDRLVTRIKEDYGVGYVDVDVTAEGEVEFLALGSRAAGIGPTLAPGTAAVAVTADPANAATPGDVVQVWKPGGTPDEAEAAGAGESGEADQRPKRVATAELRATAGDVATLALDEADASALDDRTVYRLATLPAEQRADREFATVLRSADETMSAVRVEPGSSLVGTTVADVAAVVAAVRPPEGSVQAIPPRAYAFAAGDTVYLVGRPDELRRFETLAADGEDGESDADAVTGSDDVDDGDGVDDGE
ncbi:hypothetical protein GCM10027435_28710 [Haloparvum alkalitolerans]|uniref:TrkA C-terminal domain-containing protein n=1 Tax=Haloparvum alkalitolerans TaxID=1042953 RepID=UPI003CF92640